MTHRGGRSNAGQRNQNVRDLRKLRKQELADLFVQARIGNAYDLERREITSVVDSPTLNVDAGDVLIASNQADPYVHPSVRRVQLS